MTPTRSFMPKVRVRCSRPRNRGLWLRSQPTAKSATALPGSAAAQGTSEGETLDTHRYWVQAGAFSQSADAESMRARIAFIGLDAQISYRNEGGQRLYRVRVGPFDTEAQAEEIRQSLADNAIQGNLIKLQD